MALWLCRRCTTQFAVGLHCCPQCTGTDVAEVEDMPKISVHKGPTIAGEHGSEVEVPDGAGHVMNAEAAAPDAAASAPDEEGGDEPSAGNSSSTSSEKPTPSDEQSEADRPKRARTTGNRSSKDRKGRSTARSTGTSGQETDG